MTTHRTIASLLAMVAVLLALNLVVKGSAAALGQRQAGPPPDPVLVNGTVTHVVQPAGGIFTTMYRFWSDGVVDATSLNTFTCNPNVTCGPNAFMGPLCAGRADVDRDGEVGINDFLEVLGQWGPCQ